MSSINTNGTIVLQMTKTRRILLTAAGVLLFLCGIAIIWFLTPVFFNSLEVTGRIWKALLFIFGAFLVLLGWNLFSDGTEHIETTPKKMTICRKLRSDVVIPVDHIRKIRLRRRHTVNPLRGMPGQKALHCYIEAREGSYTTMLDGREMQSEFIEWCRRHDLLKEGSYQELAWYEGHPED